VRTCIGFGMSNREQHVPAKPWEFLELNRCLADMVLLHVEEIALQTSHEPLRRIGEACKELVRYDCMAFQQGLHNDRVVDGQLLSE
jgi:hypothetical protein